MIPFINSKDCESYLRHKWKKDTMGLQESVYAVYLNSNGVRISCKRIAFGRFSKCEPDVFLIMKRARKAKCSYIILAHNHPCGNANPSEGDKLFTNNVRFALELCDFALIDHIILTQNGYFSFKDSGLLDDLNNTGYQKAG